MTYITAEVFYPAQLFDVESMMTIIENQLTMTAKAIKVDEDAITRTWKHRPRILIENGQFWRLIHADDSKKAGQVFNILDAGSPPHQIAARKAPRLAFYSKGFVAKTSPRRLYSGPGQKASKDFRQPLVVDHPGSEAREWYDTIGQKWDVEAPVQFQRAIDASVKRAEAQPPKVDKI